RWLADVLSQADADPWRRQVRQALEKQQGETVAKLLQGPEAARQPAAFLVWLGRVLPEEQALALLRRSQMQHPGDFWVNFELAAALYRSVRRGGGATRPPRAEELPAVQEAVAFGRVAVGLRPGNASAHNNLGTALHAQKDLKAAIAHYEQALALDPKYAPAHYNLGLAL